MEARAALYTLNKKGWCYLSENKNMADACRSKPHEQFNTAVEHKPEDRAIARLNHDEVFITIDTKLEVLHKRTRHRQR